MSETPQVQNIEDLMVLYEELTFLVSQLNSDAPKIKKMYTALEQTIVKQEAAASKASQVIETATSAAVSKLQKESKAVLDTAAQYLVKAEAIVQRCEAALSQIEAMAKNIQSVREYQLVVDQRLAEFEKKLHSVEAGPSIPNHHKAQNTSTDSIPETQSSSTTLIAYFKENGFKVIDYRPSGGALWVIGSEEVLKPYVNYAEKHFGVTGRYGSGRATNSKPAWWTKDKQ